MEGGSAPPASYPDSTEGLPSILIDRQHAFKPSENLGYHPFSTQPYQSETFSDHPPGFVGAVLSLFMTYPSPPTPLPQPPQPWPVRKERFTYPARLVAFCKYVTHKRLTQVTRRDIAEVLGYVSPKDYDKPLRKAVKSQNLINNAVHLLERYGAITKPNDAKPGEVVIYQVNLEACQHYAVSTPQEFTNRDIVALRPYFRNGSTFSLPKHWADVITQRQYFREAVIKASEGTTPTFPAQLVYPTTRLATPSGHRPAVIDQQDRYIIATRSLLHRSYLYCIDADHKPVCSPTLPQLIRYLSPPCPEPYCTPAVDRPLPAPPARVEGPLADYRGQVIPLSALPANARRYEIDARTYDAELYDVHRYLNAEVRARRGLIELTLKPRSKVTRRYLSVLPEVIAQAFSQHYLAKLMSALYAVADSGIRWSGLRRPVLLRQAEDVNGRALYRKPKPRPAYADLQVKVQEVRVRAKYVDLRTGHVGWRRYRYRELDYNQLLAVLGELEGKPYRLTYIEIKVVFPDPTPGAKVLRFLSAGYLYIYHSARKDPEGAVRIEFRPFKHVTSYVTPRELAILFYALASYLALAIDLNLRARHATPARPAPND